MASCYGGKGQTDLSKLRGDLNVKEKCGYLPLRQSSKTSAEENAPLIEIQLNSFQTDDEFHQGMTLMNDVIIEGKTWPFLDVYENMLDYSSYFHSHASFAVTFVDKETHGADVLGCFYIKPNYPGRCSHICNGGFITNPKYRGLGVGTFMGAAFKRLAKDLGYRGSLFNLVFASNTASVKLWKKLNFTVLAVVPGAAALAGNAEGEYTDAIQMYCDLTKEPDYSL